MLGIAGHPRGLQLCGIGLRLGESSGDCLKGLVEGGHYTLHLVLEERMVLQAEETPWEKAKGGKDPTHFGTYFYTAAT